MALRAKCERSIMFSVKATWEEFILDLGPGRDFFKSQKAFTIKKKIDMLDCIKKEPYVQQKSLRK